MALCFWALLSSTAAALIHSNSPSLDMKSQDASQQEVSFPAYLNLWPQTHFSRRTVCLYTPRFTAEVTTSKDRGGKLEEWGRHILPIPRCCCCCVGSSDGLLLSAPMELALIRFAHTRTCIYWIAACFTLTGLGVVSKSKTIDDASGVKMGHLEKKKPNMLLLTHEWRSQTGRINCPLFNGFSRWTVILELDLTCGVLCFVSL